MPRLRFRCAAIGAALTLAATLTVPARGQAQRPGRLPYPETRRVDVTDEYHGTRVADPYRWLEDLNAPVTKAWIDAQNAVTSRYLAALPARDSFRTRITALWDYPKVTLPWREGGRIWYRKNSGLQRQSALYARPTVDGPATLVIDPNALSPDGSVALEQVAPSPDGRFFAYSLAEGGADWQTVLVRDLATGRDRADTLRWVRFSGLAWTHDGNGFFYSRFPEPATGKQLEAALGPHALYYHRLGTPQSADRLVFERPAMKNWVVNGLVTDDGRYLQIVFYQGSVPKNRLYYIDLGDPKRPDVAAPLRPIVETEDAGHFPVGSVGPTFFLATDYQAPKWRIVAVDTRRPDRTHWKTVVPETEHTIENAVLAGGRLGVQHLVDAQSRLTLFGLDGKRLATIGLPGIGTVGGLSGRPDAPELFYTYTSPLYPSTVFVYDTRRGSARPFEAARPAFDVGAYQTTQHFATSKDGTRVPYFVTARKGLALTGDNPTLLYGYGGYAVSTLPTYRTDVPAWLERGGVFVTASLRGGGEYGEEWHRAGMLANKQNVFDDFIAVAEDLVRRRYTSPARLAIQGGSNGGLLVGAVMNQRPELFAAALPAVGVMDMLRYDRFTGGALWVVEFGAASDPALFPVLRKYSPLHNIKSGVCYPATLVTTADHDDRVVPSHSFKYTAALQAAQRCDRPVLIRVETKGSHGYRPTDKRIAELADQWAFVAAHTGGGPGAVQP